MEMGNYSKTAEVDLDGTVTKTIKNEDTKRTVSNGPDGASSDELNINLSDKVALSGSNAYDSASGTNTSEVCVEHKSKGKSSNTTNVFFKASDTSFDQVKPVLTSGISYNFDLYKEDKQDDEENKNSSIGLTIDNDGNRNFNSKLKFTKMASASAEYDFTTKQWNFGLDQNIDDHTSISSKYTDKNNWSTGLKYTNKELSIELKYNKSGNDDFQQKNFGLNINYEF